MLLYNLKIIISLGGVFPIFSFDDISDGWAQLCFFLHILSIIVVQVWPAFFFPPVVIFLTYVMDFITS